MKSLAISAMCCISFLFGCVVAGPAANLVMPPAHAQTRLRWEHKCWETEGAEELTELGMKAGRDGWELVAMRADAVCFKRPLL
ncbi:MAG: hypothetical protein QM784_09535 [Polyangiaceae bacterium]